MLSAWAHEHELPNAPPCGPAHSNIQAEAIAALPSKKQRKRLRKKQKRVEHELLSAPSCDPGPREGRPPANDVDFLMTLDKTSLRTKRYQHSDSWDIRDPASWIPHRAIEMSIRESHSRHKYKRKHGSFPPQGNSFKQMLFYLLPEAKVEVEIQGDTNLGTDIINWCETCPNVTKHICACDVRVIGDTCRIYTFEWDDAISNPRLSS